jgi:hypothetical protein
VETEFNEREDLTVATGEGDNEYFSFSPTRRQLQLEYRNSLSTSLDIKLAAGLQNSRYPDPDIRVAAAADVSARARRDNRKRIILELDYRHTGAWRGRLEVMLVERDSNFEEFEYDRGVLTLNLGRSFGY